MVKAMRRTSVLVLSLFWAAALFGQEPGSEARALYDRGLEGIGRATTRRELQAASTLISSALGKAPEWAEAHYAFGRVEELREVFDRAAARYERYLELAPAATDRGEVLGRIRDCRQRQTRLEKDRKLLTKGRWKWIMCLPPVRFNPPLVSTRFRVGRDGRMEAQHPYLHQLDKPRMDAVKEEWSPVTFDGRYFEYDYKVYYEALDPPQTEYALRAVRGEITQGVPIRLRQAVYHGSKPSPIFVPIEEEMLVGEVFHELR
jgi:tetratricopeptide (TPR) repeat protein